MSFMWLLVRSISTIRHYAWLIITIFGLSVAIIQGLLWHQISSSNEIQSLSLRTLDAPTQLQNPNPAIQQQYWQVGVRSGAESSDVTAMRTTIRTHLPKNVADHTTDYFWIGSYLSDKSFIQIGYAVPWYDHTTHWFYCAFTASNDRGPCVIGPPNSGGSEGSWHHYTLQTVPGNQANQWNWEALFDGKQIGIIPGLPASSGKFSPAVYVEQSAFNDQSAINDLGPIEFQPAIEVRIHNQSFIAALHGWPMYSLPQTCPPYGIHFTANNHVFLGSGLNCPSTLLPVW